MWDGSLTVSNKPREDVGIDSNTLFLVDKKLQHGSLITLLTREVSGIHGMREMVVETRFYVDRTRENISAPPRGWMIAGWRVDNVPRRRRVENTHALL
jgi:hypothetical protein